MSFLCLSIGLLTCAAPNTKTVKEWIDLAQKHADYDLTGSWLGESTDGEWGPSYDPMLIEQDNACLTGAYDYFYYLMGIVDSDHVVLFAIYYDSIYLTYHLEYQKDQEILVGKQCEGYDPKGKRCYDYKVMFRRIQPASPQ
jgi:hypothetical protein